MGNDSNLPTIHFVTTYDPALENLGGASWVDRRILETLSGTFETIVHSIANERGTDGMVRLELRASALAKVRTMYRMFAHGEPYFSAKFTSDRNWRSRTADIFRQISGGDIVVTSQFPALLASRLAGLKIDAHIAHNVDAVLANRYDPRLFRLIDNPQRTARAEIEATLWADQVWGLSRRDVDLIAGWGVNAYHLPLATGIGVPTNERRRLIGFLGKGTWPPNYSAIEEMIGEVLPLVRSALGDAAPTLVLGGRGTESWRGMPGVKVVGAVASAADFYRSIDLVAVPRLGESTGISVKMLEAISNGVPVIVPTALASDAGLNSGFLAGDSSAEIAEQIVKYYSHPGYVESCARFPKSSIPANENGFLLRMKELADAKGQSHV